MEEFFKTVAEVRSLITKVSNEAEEVKKLHKIMLSSTQQQHVNKQKLDELNCDIRRNSCCIRATLKSMQENCSPVEESITRSSVIHRIQKNQLSHLTRLFSEVMWSHHSAQMFFRERSKAQIQRQLLIVDRQTTDEELEKMLQRHSLSIFISEVMADSGTRREALSEIESRHQDIVSLESSISELQEIFTDTAQLLETQGDLINNIEKNVRSAAEYVDESKAETDKAVTFKKNPYKVASLPGFFRSFRRRNISAPPEQTTSDLDLPQ